MTAIRPADRRAKRAPLENRCSPSIGLDTRAHNREIGYVIVASAAFVSATRSVLNQIQVNIDSPRLFRANMQNEFISSVCVSNKIRLKPDPGKHRFSKAV